ncbi:hypothetical protein CCHR01_08934 [Colletotrichum chrysophilum]|uniref:Uncharacterized protein n=1 Tax=Colletotrichum chrysophilum TaxID=1836956 RepID=A0AAD9AIP7_9PEZI|nr:hypothetical protein CCHR01_08934 [Colletotrichum chrysophilum]
MISFYNSHLSVVSMEQPDMESGASVTVHTTKDQSALSVRSRCVPLC